MTTTEPSARPAFADAASPTRSAWTGPADLPSRAVPRGAGALDPRALEDAEAIRGRAPAMLATPDRLLALAASELLTAPHAEALERIARVAVRSLGVAVAQVNVVTADAQVPIASFARTERERWVGPVGLDASYCQYVVALDDPLTIADARTHPLVQRSRATTDAGIVAYAAAPLRAPVGRGGHVLGSVCVVDFAPRVWTEEDVELLEELAGLAAEQIRWRDAMGDALRRVGRDLAASEGRSEHLARALEEQLAQLESVYAHAGVGLCVFDPELRWVRINDRLAEINGLSPAAHIGRRVGELLPHIAGAAESLLREVLETGRPRLDVEINGETPARPGEQRVWQESFLPLRDGAGRVIGVNVVCHEVTAQRHADAERARLLESERAARAAAEAASRAKSDFLATMSHELRTPLNAISGYTELLQLGIYGAVSDAQRETLDRIHRSQTHLLALINEVLNYARIEAGAVRYRLSDVPVGEALAIAESLVLPQARAKGLAMEVVPCASSVVARADPEKLQQVLLNLLSNAVKFTQPGGAVRLDCVVAGGQVRVRVRDTGIGISADQCEAIFEPFVQVDAKLTRTQDGAGLGLAISRDLARGMGGDLTASSVVGAGSAFTLRLPAAPAALA